MPDRRLFDSSSLVTPPEPRVEAMTSNRVLPPDDQAERRQSARRCYDSMFGQPLKVPPTGTPVGYTLISEYRFRI